RTTRGHRLPQRQRRPLGAGAQNAAQKNRPPLEDFTSGNGQDPGLVTRGRMPGRNRRFLTLTVNPNLNLNLNHTLTLRSSIKIKIKIKSRSRSKNKTDSMFQGPKACTRISRIPRFPPRVGRLN